MKSRDYIPRLSVEIREDQLAALQQLLEHGERKKLFGILVDDVIRLLRRDKAGFLMCVYARALKLEDFSIRIGDVSHGDSTRPSQVNPSDGGRRATQAYPRSAFSTSFSSKESDEAAEAIFDDEDEDDEVD